MAKSRQGKSNFQKKQEANKEIAERVEAQAEGVNLETEVLDEEDTLETLKNLWNKYGINLSLVVLLALAAFFGYRWYTNSQENKRYTRAADLDNATTAQELMNVATKYSSHEATRNQAYYRAGLVHFSNGLSKSQSNAQESKDEFENAKKTFESLIAQITPTFEKTNQPNSLYLNAQYNLGRTYENLGDYTKAHEAYDSAIKVIKDWNVRHELKDDEGSFAAKLDEIENAKEMLSQLTTPIVFPLASTITPTTTQPAIDITETQPADTSAPTTTDPAPGE